MNSSPAGARRFETEAFAKVRRLSYGEVPLLPYSISREGDIMLDFLKSFEFMSGLGVFTYWIPLLICTCVYFFRAIWLYKSDLSRCNENHYTPKLTVGLIIWFIILSVTPCINMFAMVFDCAASVFKWIGRFFDIPLVPKRVKSNS